jgi:hypothetical protein
MYSLMPNSGQPGSIVCYSDEMELTDTELRWLFGWLQWAWKRAPSTTTWQPDVYEDHIDLGDLKSHLLEDAFRDTDALREAVLHSATTDRWPRIPRRAAYFLRERILSAQVRYGFPLGTKCPRSAIPSERGEEILRQVLVDDWRLDGAEDWCQGILDEREQRKVWFE